MDNATQDIRESEMGLCDIPTEGEIELHYRYIMRKRLEKMRKENNLKGEKNG